MTRSVPRFSRGVQAKTKIGRVRPSATSYKRIKGSTRVLTSLVGDAVSPSLRYLCILMCGFDDRGRSVER
jgi:hypothetical protein